METYPDMNTVMEAIMNDPEAAAAATEMMALQAEYGELLSKVFLGVLGAALIVGLLMLIATWRIFKKAGTGGWKALIPVYNSYSLIKISWKTRYFWILLALSIVSVTLGEVMLYFPDYELYFLVANLVCAIAALIISVKAEIKLAKAFGKGVGFAVGMIFLPFIFYPILGFGKAKFRRRKKRRKQLPAPEQA